MDKKEEDRIHDELDAPFKGSSDPFASAVRTTRMPMVITDPRQDDNPIVFCNDAFVQLTGYDRAEIMGRNCRFLQGPDTDKQAVADLGRAVANREEIQTDLLNYRKDGTTFWNSLLLCPVYADGELTYFFASQMDVTDKKRAEEHRFLLHRELDHRVKNTLAQVQSVVLQTLRDKGVAQDVASAVAARLQAVARSHDVLTKEAWASASMMDVIKGALEPTVTRFGNRIEFRGDEVRLKPRIATMLALGINELADNAIRYGALSNGAGRVDLWWTADDGMLHLEWRESGGPAVTPPSRKGYGLRIVERVLSTEFGGKGSVEFPRSGFAFRLSAPLDNLGVEATKWLTSAQ
ncbi:PAS domain-containing protein [Tianweitania sp. BSSL-BM11]|uniref:Blue-light-activated histidine kinase n=1 Tax=Tianweitania aestuarii TaxID=2814886 RepID=A0ABS5RUQ2_9HYPH|nr:HWE histidine kinase domain-containing protein [Tianweitania aestuarii]MBS9720515.1 PAS domain-containing protein [Tianweitania aestuarii]